MSFPVVGPGDAQERLEIVRMSRGKTGFLIVGAVACIVVGAGLERVRQAVLAPIPETPVLPERAQSVPLSSSRAGAETDDEKVRAALDALQKKVADLQKALGARDAELAALKQGKPAVLRRQIGAKQHPVRADAIHELLHKIEIDHGTCDVEERVGRRRGDLHALPSTTIAESRMAKDQFRVGIPLGALGRLGDAAGPRAGFGVGEHAQ